MGDGGAEPPLLLLLSLLILLSLNVGEGDVVVVVVGVGDDEFVADPAFARPQFAIFQFAPSFSSSKNSSLLSRITVPPFSFSPNSDANESPLLSLPTFMFIGIDDFFMSPPPPPPPFVASA